MVRVVNLLTFAAAVQAARVRKTEIEQQAELNATSGWRPCAFGMCYRGWGEGSRQVAGVTGTGASGNGGCRGLFRCGSGNVHMDCMFGACPKHFGTGPNMCVSSGSCRSYCDVRHAGSCRYSGPVDGQDYSRWMQEFSSRPLNQLLMVEAHHVLSELGTLDFSKPVRQSQEILRQLRALASVPGLGSIMNIAYASLLPMYSSCQSAGVASLLRSGVRGFDMRPYLSKGNNQLRVHHGGQGPLVEPAIEAIANFLRGNPTEVIVLNLQNLLTHGNNCLDCSTGDLFAELRRVLRKHFGGCASAGGLVECNADITKTVGALSGKVIIHSNARQMVDSEGYVHSSSSIYRATWHGTNDLSVLSSRILGDSESQDLSQRNDILIGHQWILTPNSDDFLGAVTQRHTGNWQNRANRHGCQSLACFGEVASARSFNANLAAIRAKYARSNFLMLDFADRQGTMDVVLAINRR